MLCVFRYQQKGMAKSLYIAKGGGLTAGIITPDKEVKKGNHNEFLTPAVIKAVEEIAESVPGVMYLKSLIYQRAYGVF